MRGIKKEGMASVKAIIADDHPLFRTALRQAAEQSIPDGDLLEAQSMGETLSMIQENPEVEIVLLDLNMPGSEGFSGLTRLRTCFPDILVIMVSALEDAAIVRRAIDLGASAYIPKSADLDTITKVINLVLDGEQWVPDYLSEAVEALDNNEEQAFAEKLSHLTPQQYRVLELIADGLLNKQIAFEINVQETTIKQHVSAILRKLGVNNRTQAGILFQQIKRMDQTTS